MMTVRYGRFLKTNVLHAVTSPTDKKTSQNGQYFPYKHVNLS